jgi:hypothetical protein
MGKDKKGDSESTLEPTPLASASIDPDARRNISARSSSRTRSNSQSVSIDFAKIGEAFGVAHEKGASTARAQIDSLQRSLEEAHKIIGKKEDLIEDKNKKIDGLIGQLAKLAEANVTSQLLEGKARLDETKAHEMHESIRQVIKVFGPAAGPLVTRVGALLLPAAGDVADKGDKSPRSCAIRVFSKLQDGSEVSSRLVGILADFAEEDWPGVIMFLSDIANAPAKGEEAH